MLKIIIVVLFVGVLASLSSGLLFLLKDMKTQDSKRTLYALGIRISLAAALIIVIGYGLYTGQLGQGAPWDAKLDAAERQSAPQPAPSAPTEPVQSTTTEPAQPAPTEPVQ